MTPLDRPWPLAQAVSLACLLEAAAPKAGNVHPGAAFADMHFGHFAASAVAVGDVLADSRCESMGELVLAAVQTTRTRVGRNTNLGTLLLFAPLALAARAGAHSAVELAQRTSEVLSAVTPRDSRLVYQAIRTAQPGGMGHRNEADIQGQPPDDLLQAMRQVSDFDAVARQLVTGYADVFDRLLPWLDEALPRAVSPLDAICRLQLRWLAYEPDGLIVRKLGAACAAEVQAYAERVARQLCDGAGPVVEQAEFQELDAYLRAAGHRRNPGTTADLLAATLLCKLLVG